MESVGFKEWALVCEALARGEQSVILRKGGIAEGRDGFAFRHREFFLFPTFFHEQAGKVRGTPADIPETRNGEVAIQLWAKLETSVHVTSWETAAALEPFHILQSEVVRERFDYDQLPGLHVGIVRIFRLRPRWIFADAPGYGGCRSWVKLPELPSATTLEPVLADEEHRARVAQLRRVLDPATAP